MKRFIITFAILLTAMCIGLYFSHKSESDTLNGFGVSITKVKHMGYDTLTVKQIDSY